MNVFDAQFDLIFVSSNVKKLREFKRLGLDMKIHEGDDIPEVDSDSETVALYKALHAGINRVVEDTILIINDEEIVDIRWRLHELKDCDDVVWQTILAFNNGQTIRLYIGRILGTIRKLDDIPHDAFGFDPYFVPNGQDKTLYQLEKEGLKDEFSARALAVNALKNYKPNYYIFITDIPEWLGHWQS